MNHPEIVPPGVVSRYPPLTRPFKSTPNPIQSEVMRRAAPRTKTRLPPRIKPIGVIRSGFTTKFAAPHQPAPDTVESNTITLLPNHNFEQALKDLAGFDRVWLIWWFHENAGWKPLVRPPRGAQTKRGVFATRSPHRPNPLGLTAVELKSIVGRTITIGPCDLLDGTPILDIKPYIPAIDSFPNAATGWLGRLDTTPHYTVQLSSTAAAQAAWLRDEFAIDFLSRAVKLLEIDPTPHRTRRITAVKDGFRMGCGGWRVYFTSGSGVVTIERLGPGYPRSYLDDPKLTKIPDRAAQRAFMDRWAPNR